MERCLKCYHEWVNDKKSSTCPVCMHNTVNLNGFKSYAPELSAQNEGFPLEAFQELIKHESTSFWFCSRNELILYFLQKYCSNIQSFLEVGCGTGFVSSGVRKVFPDIAITGSEIYTKGLNEALKRLHGSATLIQMDARRIPFAQEFDVIGAFDVLEHIDEDEKVLAEIYRSLKPSGFVFIAVPQHMWMWSDIDAQACHIRRYTQNEMQSKMERAGFEIIRSTSFVSFLLPLMWLTRKSNTQESGLTISTWQNKILRKIMQLELLCIKLGINLPVGGSRFVLGRKR